MINLRIIALLFIFGCGWNSQAKAQFINLELVIEPELSASVQQSLGFGTLIINSGMTTVNLGDPGMNVFIIRAIYTQNIYINLEFPEELTAVGSPSDNIVPIDLKLAYNNSGSDNIRYSRPLVANNGFVSVSENTSSTAEQSIWRELYVYVYGSVVVGNIDSGTYEGTVLLSIDYD